MNRNLRAGDSWQLQFSSKGYSATDGWQLKARLIPRKSDQSVIDLAAKPVGNDFEVLLKASETKDYKAGNYQLVSWVERGDDCVTLDSKEVTVLPNLRMAAPGTDTRSLAQKTLEALIEAKAQWDLSSGKKRKFKIVDREMEFNTEAEIIEKIRFWRRVVANENGGSGRKDLALLGKSILVVAKGP